MTNLALYQLSGQLQQIAQQLADDGLDADTIRDTLESISGDFDAKATQIVQIGRNLEALAEQIKAAEQQMAARRKRLEARVAAMKAYVLGEMQSVGIERIDSPWFGLSIRKNPPAVDVFDETQIPEGYWYDPPPPPKALNKDAIKAALKAGMDVPGATLKQGVRLHIE